MTRYLEQLAKDKALKPCPKCDSTESLRAVKLTSGGIHHAAIVCDHCPNPHSPYDGQTFVTWGPKPDKRPTKRDGKSTGLLNTIRAHWPGGPVYCLICLRDDRELHTADNWLEAHHIIEHQDGGTDHHTNLQPLCNECHSLVHWRRRTTPSTITKLREAAHA